ncbi:MAG: DUF1795 domain-containing protein [Acidobacteria bacterium]|nr:DUF1795 domain-containing protein [Acidobacteriota bacterium]
MGEPQIQAGELTLTIPEGWHQTSATGAVVVLTGPEAESGAYRANAVVTSFPYQGSIAKFSTMMMANMTQLLDSAFIISVERTEDSGRVIEYTHLLGGRSVHCRDRILLAPQKAYVVTASCSSAELGAMDGLLEHAVNSVELTAGSQQ